MRSMIVSLLFSGAAAVATAALSPKAVDYLRDRRSEVYDAWTSR